MGDYLIASELEPELVLFYSGSGALLSGAPSCKIIFAKLIIDLIFMDYYNVYEMSKVRETAVAEITFKQEIKETTERLKISILHI